MLRIKGGTRGEIRSSALWGTGSRGGESRSNALWGKGGRGLVTMLAAVFLLGVPLVASADNGSSGSGSPSSGHGNGTYVSPRLARYADQHPGSKLKVIIQSTGGVNGAEQAFAGLGSLHRRLGLIGAVAVEIPAARLNALEKIPGLTITPDAPVKVSGSTNLGIYSNQVWPYAAGLGRTWGSVGNAAPQAPAIAVVDSGIDTSRLDFGTRVVADVNLSTLSRNTRPGDGRGHGTFVAGIAAGSAPGYAGAAPNAPIVSLDVMDDQGMARTSDVAAACSWILANKATYNIRVANFSLHSSTPTNFYHDPLDKAVEKLWFNGVVVVAASGNYGVNGQPTRVGYAPGNDPFAITVGAADLKGTVGVGDDTAAPWSAYGTTYDGFRKPEIGAPGRYMIGPLPMTSTLATDKASNIVSTGYAQLSGTSFSAPAVSGAAAQVLARHPSWTPDQVKGALMVSARPAPSAAPWSLGVGELNAGAATTVNNPPNPNKALEQYLGVDSAGGTVFNSVAWIDAAKASIAWDDVSWTDVSWDSAAWNAVAWEEIAWDDVAWEEMSTTDIAWDDVSWIDVAWEDAAEGDANATGGYALTADQVAALSADPALAVPADVLPPSATSTTTTVTTSTSLP